MRRIFMLVMAVPLVLVGYAAPASATVVPQHVSVTLDANGTGPAVSTGAINDTGTFTTLSIRQAGKSHTSHGTFRVDFTAGSYSGKFTAIDKSESFDAATCTDTITGKGVDVINKKAGTGDYAGLKGHGHFTYIVTVTGVATTDGCDMSAPTVSNQIEVDGVVKLL
jgi:hypothetical protein